jgi:hypothetical protein
METYWLARDLNGSPIGRHQFFALITGNSPTSFKLHKSNQIITSQNLGRGYGLVLGAHNISPKDQKNAAKFNRLMFKPFEIADLAAAREYFTSSKPTGHAAWENYQPAQAKRVIPKQGVTEAQLIRSILDAVDFYIVNERNTNISYPPPYFGKNSNSWASSIMEIVPTKLPKDAHDFIGVDAANGVRIASSYFTRICFPCKIQNPAYQ